MIEDALKALRFHIFIYALEIIYIHWSKSSKMKSNDQG